jgi:hypothetical protein
MRRRATEFERALCGGQRNSLGRTDEVIGVVLDDRSRLRELFGCLRSGDELVRMRAGDALEKVCRERPVWFAPYRRRLLGEVAAIEQPSVQWHLAQILGQIELSADQSRRAKAILERNLERSDDWIVLNVTMQQLFEWSKDDSSLRRRLRSSLERLARDDRRSVARRASKLLEQMNRGADRPSA